jgi:precorrin-2 dehydrogenase/sirohydrochlorin ferrochelatase
MKYIYFKMKYYPMNIDIRGRLCVVVGGGRVAQRKVVQLLEAGGRVRVVAPRVTARLRALAARGRIRLVERGYRRGDLGRAALAFAATDSEELQARVAADARRGRVLLNVVDRPEVCDFTVPAVLRKGRVTIAVSTDGAAPYISALVKKRIDAWMDRDQVKLLDALVKARRRLVAMKKKGRPVNVEESLNALSRKRLLALARAGDTRGLRRYILAHVR